MGIKSFVLEIKATVSPSRLFKALVTDSHDVLPKASDKIKTIETVEGHGVGPGSVLKTTFPEGAHFKYTKHRVEEINLQNYSIKYTIFEGYVLGDKLEKIHQELKFEATEDGGSVIKLKIDYHTKGDIEISDEEIKAVTGQGLEIFKSCEDYLVANPDVCV